MIDRTFVEKLEELVAPTAIEVGGTHYTDRSLTPVYHDPRPGTINVTTLAGLVAYLTANVEGVTEEKLMVHVQSHEAVTVIERFEGPGNMRTVYVSASLDKQLQTFPFGQFMEVEQFVVMLQTRFVPNDGLSAVLAFAGNMTHEAVQNLADDGVTQTATKRQGIARVEHAHVPNPVSLAPYRTFREIEQVESAFLFRVRGGGEDGPPACALFEADGGEWRLGAIEGIREYLAVHLDGFTILA